MLREVLRRRRARRAARSYCSTLATHPDNRDALAGLAGSFLELDRPEEAIPVLERSLAAGLSEAAILLARAHAALARRLEEEGDLPGARRACQRALAHDPAEPEALALRTRLSPCADAAPSASPGAADKIVELDAALLAAEHAEDWARAATLYRRLAGLVHGEGEVAGAAAGLGVRLLAGAGGEAQSAFAALAGLSPAELAEARLTELTTRLAVVQAERETLTRAAARLQDEVDATRDDLAAAGEMCREVLTRLERLEGEREESARALARGRADVDAARIEIEAARGEAEAARGEAEAARGEAEAARGEAEAARGEARARDAAFAREREELSRRIDGLRGERDALAGEAARLAERRDALAAELERARAEAAAAAETLRAAEAEIARLRQEVTARDAALLERAEAHSREVAALRELLAAVEAGRGDAEARARILDAAAARTGDELTQERTARAAAAAEAADVIARLGEEFETLRRDGEEQRGRLVRESDEERARLLRLLREEQERLDRREARLRELSHELELVGAERDRLRRELEQSSGIEPAPRPAAGAFVAADQLTRTISELGSASESQRARLVALTAALESLEASKADSDRERDRLRERLHEVEAMVSRVASAAPEPALAPSPEPPRHRRRWPAAAAALGLSGLAFLLLFGPLWTGSGQRVLDAAGTPTGAPPPAGTRPDRVFGPPRLTGNAAALNAPGPAVPDRVAEAERLAGSGPGSADEARAITLLRQALALDPARHGAAAQLPAIERFWAERGNRLLADGDAAGAIAAFDAAIELAEAESARTGKPSARAPLHRAGRATAQLRLDPGQRTAGRLRAALADLDAALATWPDRADLLARRAEVSIELGALAPDPVALERALTDLDRAIALAGPDPALYEARARAWDGRADAGRAAADRQRAAELRHGAAVPADVPGAPRSAAAAGSN